MPLFHWDEETKKLEKITFPMGGWVGYNTGPLEDDYPLQRAVTIGQKVLELAPEGSELHKIESVPICCWPGARINILFMPPKPLEYMGQRVECNRLSNLGTWK